MTRHNAFVGQVGTLARKWTRNVKGDLFGGVTAAVVALPLALAYGIAAFDGHPQGAVAGLYAAFFGGILASTFGGSPAQITGPTGPMTVIMVGVYRQYGLEGMVLAMILSGLLQLLFSVLRLGRYIRYMPRPVIAGFSNGAAMLIFWQQVTALARTSEASGAAATGVLGLLQTMWHNGVLLALATMLIMFFWGRISRVVPGSLVALIVTTVAVAWAGWQWPLVGEIPVAWPQPRLPAFSWQLLLGAIKPAFALALLGTIESLLSAVVMDEIAGTRHDPNRELRGQGIANFISPLFGGLVGAGAIVRSLVNFQAGGRTPLSGVVHGLLILVITVGLGGLAAYIPLATLSGILMLTAIGMVDYQSLREVRTAPWADSAVMVVTALLTVIQDLTVAVAVGLLLSAILFTVRMSGLQVRTRDVTAGDHQVAVLQLQGPFFFGAAQNVTQAVEAAWERTPAVVIDMSQVTMIDATGAQTLLRLHLQAADRRRTLLVAGLGNEQAEVLTGLGVLDQMGADAEFASLDAALAHLASRL